MTIAVKVPYRHGRTHPEEVGAGGPEGAVPLSQQDSYSLATGYSQVEDTVAVEVGHDCGGRGRTSNVGRSCDEAGGCRQGTYRTSKASDQAGARQQRALLHSIDP